MNKLTAGLMVLLLGGGLVACDQQEQADGSDTGLPEELSAPDHAPSTVTPEGNRPDAIPAEPLVPEDRNPAEQPDAGTHGIQDGAMVPDNGPMEEPGAVPEADGEEPTTPLEEQSTSPTQQP